MPPPPASGGTAPEGKAEATETPPAPAPAAADGAGPGPSIAGDTPEPSIVPSITDAGTPQPSIGPTIAGSGTPEPSIGPTIAGGDTVEPSSAPTIAEAAPPAAGEPAPPVQEARAEAKAEAEAEPEPAPAPDVAGHAEESPSAGGEQPASPTEEAEEAPTRVAAAAPKTPPPSPPAGALGPQIALAPVPDPGLVRDSPDGPLPVIAPDGREPWRVYARPFSTASDRPRVAILLRGIGLSQSASNAAIQQLPGEITLALAAYAPNLTTWVATARAAGHEVLLQVPMEPHDYPASDPGPHTLLTSLSADANGERLQWLLGRFAGYVGIANIAGAKFATSPDHVRPILLALKERGLMIVDGRAARNSLRAPISGEVGVPHAINNRFIDNEASRVAIDARLFELERIAQSVGFAVGIGYPFPVTIERLAAWVKTLDQKGLALAPVSAVAVSEGGE